ncbi:hypothetical protein, partial [Pseudomonas savastanoi]
ERKPEAVDQTLIQFGQAYYMLQLGHPLTSSKIIITLEIELSAAVQTGMELRPTGRWGCQPGFEPCEAQSGFPSIDSPHVCYCASCNSTSVLLSPNAPHRQLQLSATRCRPDSAKQ